MPRALGTEAENSDLYRQWAEQLDEVAEAETPDRNFADLVLARLAVRHGNMETGILSLERALARSSEIDDSELVALATAQYLRDASTPGAWRGVVEMAQRPIPLALEGVRPESAASLFRFRGQALLLVGDREGAEREWALSSGIRDRIGEPRSLMSDLGRHGVVATIDGRLSDAIVIAEDIYARALELGSQQLGVQFALRAGGRAAAWLGRWNLFDTWTQAKWTQSFQAYRAALTGEPERAAQLLQEELRQPGHVEPESTNLDLAFLTLWIEIAILLQDRAAADAIWRHLKDGPPFPTDWSPALTLPAIAGEMASLQGNRMEAAARFGQAIVMAERMQNRPGVAISALRLAECWPLEGDPRLERHDPPWTDPASILTFVSQEFHAMGMRAFLDRALRCRLALQGVLPEDTQSSIDLVSQALQSERPQWVEHTAPDGTVTLLFTDIEDSTGHTLRLGDQRWLEILRAHHALVRELVARHGGFEVKSQGDGFMLAFSSARRALDCAIAIQRTVQSGNAGHPDAELRVRIGLHAGEALKESNDFHGKHVVLAARIADQARGGEILVSSLLKELTDTAGVPRYFDEGRDVELKGLSGVHRVFSVRESESPIGSIPGDAL